MISKRWVAILCFVVAAIGGVGLLTLNRLRTPLRSLEVESIRVFALANEDGMQFLAFPGDSNFDLSKKKTTDGTFFHGVRFKPQSETEPTKSRLAVLLRRAKRCNGSIQFVPIYGVRLQCKGSDIDLLLESRGQNVLMWRDGKYSWLCLHEPVNSLEPGS